MKQIVLLLISVLVFATRASGTDSTGVVESIEFSTTQPMPVFEVPNELRVPARFIEANADRFAEGGLLTTLIKNAPNELRLTNNQSTELTVAFERVYRDIAKDAAFAKVPSAMRQILSHDVHRKAHYFLYKPATVAADTKILVFLHGFGGNLQFYMYLLKTAFPDSVIVCPSYGIAWDKKGEGLLREILQDVQKRSSLTKFKPWLMAISSGGPAGFSIYDKEPDRFEGLILLATYPDWNDVQNPHDNLRVLMLNGVRDDRCPIQYARQVASQLKLKVKDTQAKELNDGDHFFMLTMADETFKAIKDFMEGTTRR